MQTIIVIACAALVAGALTAAPVSATTRAVGATYTYIVQSKSTAAEPPNLPPAMHAQFEATQGKMTTSTMTLTIDTSAADGDAHANGTYVNPPPSGASPLVLRAYEAQNKKFQATIAPDGRILPIYDQAQINAIPGMSYQQQQQAYGSASVQQGILGQTVALTLSDFNLAALACGGRANLKPGDSWQGSGATTGWTFAVTGADSIAGHAVVVVSMKSSYSGQNASSDVQSVAYYDPSARLLVKYHQDSTTSNSQVPGSSIASLDIALST